MINMEESQYSHLNGKEVMEIVILFQMWSVQERVLWNVVTLLNK